MTKNHFRTDWHLSSSGLYLMGRLRFLDGNYITQALTDGVQMRTRDAAGVVNSDDEDLNVATVVFDTLQKKPTDQRWTVDGIGYNLGVIIPAARLVLAGINTVELIVTPDSGEAIAAQIEIPTKALVAF